MAVVACAQTSQAAINGSDDFHDNVKNTTKWDADIIFGHGAVTETNQHLEYTVAVSGAQYDFAYRPWLLNDPAYNDTWEAVLDVHNEVTPDINQIASVGIEVFNFDDSDDSIYLELYASGLSGLPPTRGFFCSLLENGRESAAPVDSLDLGVTNGALRIVYQGQTKVVFAYYDPDGKANGYAWTLLASFGINNSGGADGNARWGMTSSDIFLVSPYGYSERMLIPRNRVWADNFSAATAIASTPPLAAARNGAMLLVSWPQSAFQYEPQSASRLSTNPWNVLNMAPDLSNNTYRILIPLSGAEHYFRLRKP